MTTERVNGIASLSRLTTDIATLRSQYTDSRVTKTSTSTLTSGAIFDFTGTVGIVSITGRVTTGIQAQATTCQLTVTCDALAAYAICATLDIASFGAGSLLSITGTAADAMVGTTVVGAIAPGQVAMVVATCVTSGTINTVFGAGSTGVIVWEALWVPLSTGATLVAS